MKTIPKIRKLEKFINYLIAGIGQDGLCYPLDTVFSQYSSKFFRPVSIFQEAN